MLPTTRSLLLRPLVTAAKARTAPGGLPQRAWGVRALATHVNLTHRVPTVGVRRNLAAAAAAAATAAHAQPQVTPLTETVRDFLEPEDFYGLLQSRGIDFYTGVPDSLLKEFCAYVTDHSPPERHIISANEGCSVATAAGYHMATGKYPLVYMQNSGFGNCVNPLLSLCDRRIYQIPMLLMIGWRGEPGKKDEPQHLVQGRAMSSLLTDMNIQFEVLPDYLEGYGGAEEAVDHAIHHMNTRSVPYAFLVRRQTFSEYRLRNAFPNEQEMTREQALDAIIHQLGLWDIIVSTTGFASRELYELREGRGEDHKREFLTVGSMGHSSSIAFGVALAKPSRQVVCLDGDGACLMHMGSMTTIGTQNPAVRNFKHILLNNGAHDSVGGQPTAGFDVDFCGMARAAGYRTVIPSACTEQELVAGVRQLRDAEGPAFLEVRVNKGARSNLGRPKTTPVQNKEQFMGFVSG